nr:uncharacterized protein LOC124809195 isoform X3 [Hydra vulgaris]
METENRTKRRRLNKSILDFIMKFKDEKDEINNISTPDLNPELNAFYVEPEIPFVPLVPFEALNNDFKECGVTSSSSSFRYENYDCYNASPLLTTETLSEDLAVWSTKSKISQSLLNELIMILRKYGHSELPNDARTLLKPFKVVKVHKKCGGTYAYFTIADSLNYFMNTKNAFQSTELSITINVDGLPLFKSSNLQLWPILGLIENYIFIIALFCGDAKPNCLDDFLNDFIKEFLLLTNEGFYYNNNKFKVTLKAFICDAPSRCFLKCIQGHTGYYSCERCQVKGLYEEHRVVFIDNKPSTPRLTEEFNTFVYTQHQKSLTPLAQLEISCISDFVLDYMHMVCLGVVRRILTFLKSGPKHCRLSNAQIKNISDNLLSLRGMMPSEFARQPRSLLELDRWKATEFRQYILYTGPLVLKGVVSKEIYNHFLTLHVAMVILLNEDNRFRKHYLTFARELLNYFVINSKYLYTKSFCVYNVHSLLHICDDVVKFDCSLNDISCFPFENFMQTLKKAVKNSKSPVVQIAKQYERIQSLLNTKPRKLKISILSPESQESKKKLLKTDVQKTALGPEKLVKNQFPMEVGKYQHMMFKMLSKVLEKQELILALNKQPQSNIAMKQLETIAEFEDFNKSLVDDCVRLDLVKQLSFLCAEDFKQLTRLVMNRLFTNTLLTQFNLKGSGGKIGLHSTKLYDVIEVVKRKFEKVSNADTKQQIGRFLKKCSIAEKYKLK